MATYVKGIGDAVTGKNEILPSFDAKIFRYITQNLAGVIGTENSKFPLTVVDRGVQIGIGMVQAFGYFGMSDSIVQHNFIFPSGSAQYARIYAEINLSIVPHEFSIKASPQSSTSNIQLIQDDLSVIPSGIYQVPLYLLELNLNNTIVVTDQREILQRLEYATNAVNLINGGTIASDVEAITQAQTDNSTKVATTAYVRKAVADCKNIIEGTITLPSGYSASISYIRRQVNFVIGYLRFKTNNWINAGWQTIANLPEGFRPRVETSQCGRLPLSADLGVFYGGFFVITGDLRVMPNGDLQINNPIAGMVLSYDAQYSEIDCVIAYEIT